MPAVALCASAFVNTSADKMAAKKVQIRQLAPFSMFCNTMDRRGESGGGHRFGHQVGKESRILPECCQALAAISGKETNSYRLRLTLEFASIVWS